MKTNEDFYWSDRVLESLTGVNITKLSKKYGRIIERIPRDTSSHPNHRHILSKLPTPVCSNVRVSTPKNFRDTTSFNLGPTPILLSPKHPPASPAKAVRFDTKNIPYPRAPANYSLSNNSSHPKPTGVAMISCPICKASLRDIDLMNHVATYHDTSSNQLQKVSAPAAKPPTPPPAPSANAVQIQMPAFALGSPNQFQLTGVMPIPVMMFPFSPSFWPWPNAPAAPLPSTVPKPSPVDGAKQSATTPQPPVQQEPKSQPQPPAPTAQQPAAAQTTKLHVCVTCKKSRSSMYHRAHPLIPGKVPTPGECHRCQNIRHVRADTESEESLEFETGFAHHRCSKNSRRGEETSKVLYNSDEEFITVVRLPRKRRSEPASSRTTKHDHASHSGHERRPRNESPFKNRQQDRVRETVLDITTIWPAKRDHHERRRHESPRTHRPRTIYRHAGEQHDGDVSGSDNHEDMAGGFHEHWEETDFKETTERHEPPARRKHGRGRVIHVTKHHGTLDYERTPSSSPGSAPVAFTRRRSSPAVSAGASSSRSHARRRDRDRTKIIRTTTLRLPSAPRHSYQEYARDHERPPSPPYPINESERRVRRERSQHREAEQNQNRRIHDEDDKHVHFDEYYMSGGLKDMEETYKRSRSQSRSRNRNRVVDEEVVEGRHVIEEDDDIGGNSSGGSW